MVSVGVVGITYLGVECVSTTGIMRREAAS